jgi:uncharacterized membrane protein
MSVSRLIWREDADTSSLPFAIPLVVYVANLAFAMVLSGGVGLWQPILLAALLGLVPAALAVAGRPRSGLRVLRWAQDA